VGEDFEDALEGGSVGRLAEIVVASRAGSTSSSEMSEAEVDGLFRRSQVGKNDAQQFKEIHEVNVACGRGEEEKGRGH
jgi:hypothetical protein